MHNVLVLPGDLKGSGFYRAIQPYQWLAKTYPDDYHVIISTPNTPTGLIKWANVIVMQTVVDMSLLQLILTNKSPKTKIVFDIDDAVFSMPDWNVSKVKMTPETLRQFKVMMLYADCVVAATAPLVEVVIEHAKIKREKLTVIPNGIDLSLFPEPKPNKDFILGWSGSAHHHGDMMGFLPILKKTLNFYPSSVKIEFIGANYGLAFSDIKERYSYIQGSLNCIDDYFINKGIKSYWYLWDSSTCEPQWMGLMNVPKPQWLPLSVDNNELELPTPKYYKILAKRGWSIAVAPLLDCTFNKCKSAQKLMELGALGIPVAVSDVAPYRDYMEGVRVCNDEDSWIKALGELLARTKRKELKLASARAREQAEKHDIRLIMPSYKDMLERVCPIESKILV